MAGCLVLVFLLVFLFLLIDCMVGWLVIIAGFWLFWLVDWFLLVGWLVSSIAYFEGCLFSSFGCFGCMVALLLFAWLIGWFACFGW